MSTKRRPRPALVRPVPGVLLALALTGCGASLDAQTYQERTQADAANAAVGTLALRGIAVEPAGRDRTHEVGDDAEVTLVITNDDDEPDTLLEVTSPDAESVEIIVDDAEDTLEVPALGSVGDGPTLRLVGLTEELREGEYTVLTFRFERNGTVVVDVPVRSPGVTDRPVYTGGGGEEGEPALQAPAGGHGESEGEGSEGEGEGVVGEGEAGQGADEGGSEG